MDDCADGLNGNDKTLNVFRAPSAEVLGAIDLERIMRSATGKGNESLSLLWNSANEVVVLK